MSLSVSYVPLRFVSDQGFIKLEACAGFILCRPPHFGVNFTQASKIEPESLANLQGLLGFHLASRVGYVAKVHPDNASIRTEGNSRKAHVMTLASFNPFVESLLPLHRHLQPNEGLADLTAGEPLEDAEPASG